MCRKKYCPISPDYVSRMLNVPFKDAAFGTYQSEDYMSTLKKYAKKLDYPIDELHARWMSRYMTLNYSSIDK